MAREYDKNLIKKGILKYNGALYVYNKEKSVVLISVPIRGIKELNIEKETDLEISIKKK